MAQDAGIPVFDFDTFNSQLEEQRALIANRQAEEQRTLRTQQDIAERSHNVAREYDTAVDPIRKGLVERRQKADHARSLADSGNVVDVLRLMGLQTMDPAGYRRDVRTARTAEDTQYASALGQMHNVSQSALQYELVASSGKLNEAKLLETIGIEKLKAIQEEGAILRDNLAASATMQFGAISQMTPEELESGVMAAKKNGGRVNINGVDISSDMLETRLDAMKERTYQRTLQQHLRELGEVAIKENDKGVADEINRRTNKETLSSWETDAGARENRRKLEVIQANEALTKASQKKELDTMELEELSQIMANNYRVGDVQYTPEDVNAAWSTRQETRAARVQQSIQDLTIQQFDMEAIRGEADRLDILTSRYRQNSPLMASAQKYRAALGLLSDAAKSEDMTQRLVGYQTFEMAKEEFDKQIQKQVAIEAPGDKAKQGLLAEFYRGNPIPQAELRTALQERLLANRTPADLVPPEVAAKMTRKYNETYQQILKAEGFGGLAGDRATSDDRKRIQAEAAQRAIDWAVKQETKGRTTEILANQVFASDHPLRKLGWTPAKMAGHLRLADDNAYTQWRREYELSEEEAATIRSGDNVDGKDGPGLRARLRHLENGFIIEDLNGVEPGLGNSFSKWWAEKGQEYVAGEQQSFENQNAKGDFSKLSVRSMAGKLERDSMLDYALALQDSEGSIRQEESENRANFLSFGGNPINSQAMILHYDKNLNPDEKGILFERFVAPLLSEAQKRGLSFSDTNRFVEERILSTTNTGDVGIDKLLKTMKRDRADNVRIVGDMLRVGRVFDRTKSLEKLTGRSMIRRGTWADRFIGEEPETDPGKAQIDWFLRWRNKQPAAPTGG